MNHDDPYTLTPISVDNVTQDELMGDFKLYFRL